MPEATELTGAAFVELIAPDPATLEEYVIEFESSMPSTRCDAGNQYSRRTKAFRSSLGRLRVGGSTGPCTHPFR